jgi:Cytochrome C oxidase, cbb3-type, subunit III
LKCDAQTRLRPWLAAALALAVWSLACRRDMQVQPRYNPYDASNFFDNGRSARQPVPGTVARSELRVDELLYTGKLNGADSPVFPFPITRADLERGQLEYNIYCSPCHDYTGTGRGMIVLRGFPQPPSFHAPRLVQAAAGHFFDVMTNGFGVMYPYNDRVTPVDRWRIAAYIRALQLSQNASLADVPAEQRQNLSPPGGAGPSTPQDAHP